MHPVEYQVEAVRTANTALTHQQRLPVASLGLCGEAGEVADHIKKHLGHGQTIDKEKVAKELGDVLWYTAELCTLLGFSLEDIMQRNIEKLRKRWPDKFDPTLPQAAGDIE